MEFDQSIRTMLLSINVAGWHTHMEGADNRVLFVALHRRTGKVIMSRGRVVDADQALRRLWERCVGEVGD